MNDHLAAVEVETAVEAARPSLASVARLALWLGLTGFGGGYAVLAQLRMAVVDRRRWLTREEYSDLVSVSQSLPGAPAANFFTHLGLRAAGIGGALLATALFSAPSATLLVALGVSYEHLRGLAQVEALFAGMNPALVGIIAAVAWNLGRAGRRPHELLFAGAAAAAIDFDLLDIFQLVLLTVTATAVISVLRRRGPGRAPMMMWLPLSGVGLLPKLGWVFLRIGAVSFGGGLAMIPMIDHDLVGRLHWLLPGEFSDAITLGQITPGPVAITATFVGYRVAGLGGAMLSTVAVFLPAFASNVVAGRSLAAFRNSPFVRDILDALGPLVLGMVVAALISLARATVHGYQDALVAGGGAIALIVFDAPALLVLAVAVLVHAVTGYWRH